MFPAQRCRPANPGCGCFLFTFHLDAGATSRWKSATKVAAPATLTVLESRSSRTNCSTSELSYSCHKRMWRHRICGVFQQLPSETGPSKGGGVSYDYAAPVRSLGAVVLSLPRWHARSPRFYFWRRTPHCPESDHPQSSWSSHDSLRELPHRCRLAAHPRRPRVRSQQNQISAAGHARKGGLHALPRKARFRRRWQELRRLPRRHSSPPVRAQLRAVPYCPGLGCCHTTAEGPPESLPTLWRSRRRWLRGMPQGRRYRRLLRPIYAMRFLPLKGLGKHYESSS